jgi:hypothetical protein
VTVRGDKLVIRGPRGAGRLAERLLARKREVIQAVTGNPPTPADLPGDWHLLWEERAAIREYHGGLPRDRAEALARVEIFQMSCMKNSPLNAT